MQLITLTFNSGFEKISYKWYVIFRLTNVQYIIYI